MTRAISIEAPPERVWPWIAQLGRGAGWYSVDRLDNGKKTSARHIVSWIPEPRPGDATAIGYLRHVEPGRSLAWWLGHGKFVGATVRLVTCFALHSDDRGTRVVSRLSADATGATAHLALLTFRAIDSVMACRQLVGLRHRAQSSDESRADLGKRETGDRAQYQLYEILYASGEQAGVEGTENGAVYRRSAIRDGVIVT